MDYLPCPLDRPDVQGVGPRGEPLSRPFDDNAPLSSLAFKIMNDPFVGSLTFCRVYSGVMKTGSAVLNAAKDKQERIGRMLQMHANERVDVKEARSGN